MLATILRTLPQAKMTRKAVHRTVLYAITIEWCENQNRRPSTMTIPLPLPKLAGIPFFLPSFQDLFLWLLS